MLVQLQSKYLVARDVHAELKYKPVFAVVVNVSRLLAVPLVKYKLVPSGSVAISLALIALLPAPRANNDIVAFLVFGG